MISMYCVGDKANENGAVLKKQRHYFYFRVNEDLATVGFETQPITLKVSTVL